MSKHLQLRDDGEGRRVNPSEGVEGEHVHEEVYQRGHGHFCGAARVEQVEPFLVDGKGSRHVGRRVGGVQLPAGERLD